MSNNIDLLTTIVGDLEHTADRLRALQSDRPSRERQAATLATTIEQTAMSARGLLTLVRADSE